MSPFLKTFATYTLVFLLGGAAFFTINNVYFERSTQSSSVSQTDTKVFDEISKTQNSHDDGYLNKLLLEYEEKIAFLLNENESLSGKYLLSNTQLQALASKPDIEKKINNMSDSDIRKKLNLILDEDHISDIQDTRAFAGRLAEVAMESTDENSGSSENTNIDVRISISSEIGYHEMPTSDVVASKYKRLYANILSAEALDYVLVKWKNVSTDELLFYKGVSFNPVIDDQFIWTKPENGWERGVYQINIYKIDDELQLLANKRFTVSDVIDEGPEEPVKPVEGISVGKQPVN